MLPGFHQKYLGPVPQFTETSLRVGMNSARGQIGVFVSGHSDCGGASLELTVGMWNPWNKLPLICPDSTLAQLRCTSALALCCSAQLLVPVRTFRSPLLPVLFKLTKCRGARKRWQQPENRCQKRQWVQKSQGKQRKRWGAVSSEICFLKQDLTLKKKV